jgi:hypothetical protein
MGNFLGTHHDMACDISAAGFMCMSTYSLHLHLRLPTWACEHVFETETMIVTSKHSKQTMSEIMRLTV